MLEEQWQVYQKTANERTKPDYISYTAAMKAWVNSGSENATARVNRLLNDMLSRYEDGDASFRPSRPTYDILRQAFALDEEALLARMEEVRQRITGNAEYDPSNI